MKMPTQEFIKKEFSYGYSSGDILSEPPDPVTQQEEACIGGRYREVFMSLILPNLKPGNRILELGPGRGSWTAAMLRHGPECEIHTVDFQDLGRWIDIPAQNGRLVHHQVEEGHTFTPIPKKAFDFFFAWGVLCHWGKADIRQILSGALACMKPDARAVVQYAAWDKLDVYGWERGRVPETFRELDDKDMWWPRNTVADMAALCRDAGWVVIEADCGIVGRDGVALLSTPAAGVNI
jgi:SAM-dependent methyltransferase